MYTLIYLCTVREHNPIKASFQNHSLIGKHVGLITEKFSGQDCRSAEILWDRRSMTRPPNHTLGSKSPSSVCRHCSHRSSAMVWPCLLQARKGRTKLMWPLGRWPSSVRRRQARYHGLTEMFRPFRTPLCSWKWLNASLCFLDWPGEKLLRHDQLTGSHTEKWCTKIFELRFL